MAGFNRFRGGGLGSLYPGINNNLQQGNVNRVDERFDERRSARGGGTMQSAFERREDRDFGRLQRDPSPRRRRYSPDPPYNSLRGNRREDRGDYSMDHVGDNFSSRGQRNNESEFSRAGRSLGTPNRGDGILGAKPGDMPRELASSSNTGGGLTSQLAQHQQQLMAMVQTQSLLAAIQAQASAAAKRGGVGSQPPSLMQGMRLHDNRGHMDNRQIRKRRMSPNRGLQRNRNQQGFRQRSQTQRSAGWQNRDRDRNYQNQRRERERNNRMSESSKKPDDSEPIEEPYIEENPDEEEQMEAVEENEEIKELEAPKSEESKEKKEEEVKKEQTPETEESKAKSQPDEPAINLAGQKVDQLCRSLFDHHRHKYVCKVCKIMCTKEMSFRQHLFGRRHVKTWLESQGRSFEAEIFRKATEEAAKTLTTIEQPKPAKEETPETSTETETPALKTDESSENKDEQQPAEAPAAEVQEEPAAADKEPTPPSDIAEAKPEPVEEVKEVEEVKVVKEVKKEKKEQKLDVKYSCDTRKTAVKDGDYITISSVNEARVRINGFDTGINTEGCEFVKAVSGFQCRLCKTFIARGHDVMKHVRGRKHQSNYRVYIHEHLKYEANQKCRNKELANMLSEREGNAFLLYEVSDEEEETRRPSRYRSDNPISVRITKYVVANEEEQEASASMEDKTDEDPADNHEPEPSQEDSHDQDKPMDGDGDGVDDGDDNGVGDGDGDDNGDDNGDDGDANEGEKVETHLNDDIDLDSEDLLKEDDTQELTEEKNVDDPVDISLDADVSLDLANELLAEDDEPAEKKAKVTPTGRRGRKAARGGAQGGRGRGRGRGGRRNTRQSPKAAPKTKLNSDDTEMNNEDVDFMDGYEVIDEVADDET